MGILVRALLTINVMNGGLGAIHNKFQIVPLVMFLNWHLAMAVFDKGEETEVPF